MYGPREITLAPYSRRDSLAFLCDHTCFILFVSYLTIINLKQIFWSTYGHFFMHFKSQMSDVGFLKAE